MNNTTKTNTNTFSRRSFLNILGGVAVVSTLTIPMSQNEFRNLLSDFVGIYQQSSPIEKAAVITEARQIPLSEKADTWWNDFLTWTEANYGN